MILQTDPTGAQTITTYNSDGLVATVTDALGRQKINAYDNNGWLLSQTWKDSSGTVVDVQRYTWNSDGTLATAANNAGTYTFGYDGDGRVASITDPNNITLNYGYDAASNMTSITDNRGATVASTFDPTNQLSSRSLSGSGVSSPLSVQFTRDNNGSVTQTRRYSDATGTNLVSTTDFGRDPVGNLTSQTHKNGSGTTLVSYTNIFDALNRITNETRNGIANNFAYDAVSEVTSAGSQAYSYSLNGNRNSAGYTVGADNHISSDGTSNYMYDAVGNTVRITKIADGSYWSLSYSLNNQVTAAKQYNVNGSLLQEVDYVYDVFGHTIARTVTISGISTTTKFAYDVSGASIGINTHVNPLWAELDSNGNITEHYLTDDAGNKLARSGSGANGTAWLLTDRVGSVREVLDVTGNLKSQISYDAFGNPTTETDSTWSGNYLFQGLFRDRIRNVNRAVWREELADGQWGVKDQSGFGAGDTNLDRAIGNNAVNGTDPSGLQERQQSSPYITNFGAYRCAQCHGSLDGKFKDIASGLNDYTWKDLPPAQQMMLELQSTYQPGPVERTFKRVWGNTVGMPSNLFNASLDSYSELESKAKNEGSDMPAWAIATKVPGEIVYKTIDALNRAGGEIRRSPENATVENYVDVGMVALPFSKKIGSAAGDLIGASNPFGRQPFAPSRLFGHNEYVVVDAAHAARVRQGLEAYYRQHAPRGATVRWVDNVPGGRNGYLDTVTGEIRLSNDLLTPQYRHLADGVLVEELQHFHQLQSRGWIGPNLTAAENALIEQEVVQRIQRSGFRIFDPRRP